MFRVVSFPATSSWTRNIPSSASLSRSPSTSAAASLEMMSSAGRVRRSAAAASRYSTISPLRAMRSSSGQSVAPGMTASDHRKNRGHSSSGTPSSDSTRAESRPVRTPSSRARMKLGRKPGCTRLR